MIVLAFVLLRNSPYDADSIMPDWLAWVTVICIILGTISYFKGD